MIELSPNLIVIMMFGGIIVGAIIGIPIGLVVGVLGLGVGYIVFEDAIATVLYSRVYEFLITYVLLAVPLFVFMGSMLERSGIAERLYSVLYLWLGGFRGGLAIVSVLIGTIMAATVGIIAASITMLTLTALPSMLKRGYSKSLATGSICAGGCLGILIPPSVMLVIYGPMAQISVGKLFFSAFLPGFLLSTLYCSYIAIRCFIQPSIAPAVPIEERAVPFVKKTAMLLVALLPPAILIMSVLGVIFLGIAPPTEAAGIGALVATLLTICYRRFTLQVLKDVSLVAMKSLGFIFFLGSMAFFFVGVFIGAGGDKVVTEAILNTPGGRWGAFAIIMFLVFLLGFLMDWIGIAFIMVPIITPIGAALGFDPLWFAMMICINFQTAFMTPPFAFAIFIVKGTAAPELGVRTIDIIRGVIPFVLLILVGLGLCIAFPEIITWLPSKMIK